MSGRRSVALSAAVVVAAFASAGACACAADPSAQGAPDRVLVGLDGAWRTGGWTPVVVETTAAGAGDRVAVWADDPDGQAVRSPDVVLEEAAPGVRRARLRVRSGRPDAGLRVDVIAASGTVGAVVRPPRPLDPQERLFVVVGDLPAVARAARLAVREGLPRPRVVAVSDPVALGRDALDFSAADAIVVCGRAVAALGAEGRAGLEGIDEWVRQGGRLVLVAGASAADPAFVASPAAAWLPGPAGRPGTVERLVPLRRAAAIEAYARAGRPLDRAALDRVEVPLLADARSLEGVIEAYEGTAPGDLPLVVRGARGFGTVTWLGLDIDGGAFRDWTGAETLLVELLGGRPRAETSGRAGEAVGQGQDLTGQLRAAVDQFPGVAAVPFEIIALLSLAYIAFLYPLDWWLVSRSRAAGGASRAGLSWLTLPVGVALFAGAAWWVARHWKGDQWRASRAGIVDIDQSAGAIRALSLAGIWSPQNDRVTVSAGPADTAPAGTPRLAVSWLAAAGKGIGATDSPTSHPGLATADYTAAPAWSGLDGVPIAADSSRLFEATWHAPTTGPAVAATIRRGAQGTLTGTIENRLPFTLSDCVLLHAGWLWDVGDLEPGGRFDAGAGRGPRSLAGGLTRRTTVKDREVNERWDTGGRDALRILEIAGFHAAVGGSGYTALEAGRLERLDLSPLLAVGRAVLVGRGPPGTAWRQVASGAGDVGATAPAGRELWRIVIPVGGGTP